MFLKHMKEARKYEKEIENPKAELATDGVCYNPRCSEFDTSNRDQWAYVGLDDNEFEVKKKMFDEWKEAVASEGISWAASHCCPGWATCGGGWEFFEVYENERDRKPIAYLVIHVIERQSVSSEFAYCNRAMALADEVKGWEAGKIQALLLNRLCHWQYAENENRDFIPFDDDNGSRRIKASCENNGFVVCKAERNAKLSKMEKDEYKWALWH